jgi:hypothetical protein
MKTLILLISLLIIISNAYSQNFDTINIDFTKTVKHGTSNEIVKGTFYYSEIRTILAVQEPLNQWMIIEFNNMLIYYPDKNRAINITSQNPFNIPFFQTFTGLNSENLGLSKLGYTIDKNEIHGDTLLVYWQPPVVNEMKLGEIILSLVDNNIVVTETKDHSGNTNSYTTYNNYISHNDHYFPLLVNSTIYSEGETKTEIIKYTNPVFDQPLPDEITNFILPENAEIKEIEW